MDETDTTLTRSPMGIDLNEIPSLSSPPLPGQTEPTEPYDSFDVVRLIHENRDPAPGAAASLPGKARGACCGGCGKPEGRGQVVVCDGCERGFHVGCTPLKPAADWLCGECVSSSVKSKRWQLGVKSSNSILDINASPPTDADVDGEYREEFMDSRKFTGAESSFGENSCGAQATDPKKGSGLQIHPSTGGVEDVLNHAQFMARSLEEGLREFISESHGALEEGWSVELKQSMDSDQLFAVYYSPDGKEFGSVLEVASHLGLMAKHHLMRKDTRNNRSPSLHGRVYTSRKRKSRSTLLANGFTEIKDNLVNGYHKEHVPNGHRMEIGDRKPLEVMEDGMESVISKSEPANEELPIQFEDFFVISLGEIDARPSYHEETVIWPVGYRSCWHDKVTGSFFMCEVSDGGNSGPIFKIRRHSCSSLPVPDAVTVLSRTEQIQLADIDNNGSDVDVSYNTDSEFENYAEIILMEPSPPTENDLLTCLSGDLGTSSRQSKSKNYLLGDEIGEIYAEEQSSSSAWKMVSQKLIAVYADRLKRFGFVQFLCSHIDNDLGLFKWDTKNDTSKSSVAPVTRFCSPSHFVSIQSEYTGDLDSLSAMLSQWLDQDRIGLDAEFVQERIEQLPKFKACSKYKPLVDRDHYSTSITVGNKLLVSKRKSREESDDYFWRCKKPRSAEESLKHDPNPPKGRELCSMLPPMLVGDCYQIWEVLSRFCEILELKEPVTLETLEKELTKPFSHGSNGFKNFRSKIQIRDVSDLRGADGNTGGSTHGLCDLHEAAAGNDPCGLISVETPMDKDTTQIPNESIANDGSIGETLTKVHILLLGVLIRELQSKVAALVDPNFDVGESKAKRGRKKEAESTIVAKSKLYMLPINDLTWPELARRYILAFLAMDGSLDSPEIIARECGKVFRCLQGDGGVLCGSLTGVAGMELDALLLAEATKQIFGSLTRGKDFLILEDEVTDTGIDCEKKNVNDGSIPEWAKSLEPVRKLPTNVGTRIRKCVYEALENCPPEWAKKRLEHSISKEVYKGNASGPTKRAVLSVLEDVMREGVPVKIEKIEKKKISVCISDIIMKKCRIVLRHVAAADDDKVFCTLLGRKLIGSHDNDDEGLLGTPAMISHPVDFRTIDLRLAVGAYGGLHESFLEDVRELWSNIRTAFHDQYDVIELAETLSQKFESMYETEVVPLVEKFEGYAQLDRIDVEAKKEIDELLAPINEIPKAPWDEGVCKVCGVDKHDDSVLLCDTCDAEYHTYCLNPPLATIPKGNWYCPSCVVDGRTIHAESGFTQVNDRSRRRKYQGEVMRGLLDTVNHLAVKMEEKEYWGFSINERIALLKFLCDELLNSALVHQHLEQCTEAMAELQQKLRSLSVELKNLKSRDDFLASKAAKMDSIVVGESGVGGITNQCCSVDPLPGLSDGPSNYSAPDDDLPAKGSRRVGAYINGCDGNHTSTHAEEEVNLHREGQTKDQQNVVDVDSPPFIVYDGSLEQYQLEKDIDRNEIQPGGHLNGCDKMDTDTLMPTLEMNAGAAHTVLPVAMTEPQINHHDLNSTINETTQLQYMISSTESQLLRHCIRREFLGIDSWGCLYWASTTSRVPQIIVDGSSMSQPKNDSWHPISSGVSTYLNFGKPKSGFPLYNLNGVVASCSPLVSYETESEISELVGWLKDNDQNEKKLKESTLQWMKIRFQKTQKHKKLEDQHRETSSKIASNGNAASSHCLLTKAAMLIETKYGPYIQLDAAALARKLKKERVSDECEVYRCNCMEPIWPSRYHCFTCHRTFSGNAQFEEHDTSSCTSPFPVPQTSIRNGDSFNENGIANYEIPHKDHSKQMNMTNTSKSGCSQISSKLIKFQDEVMVSPFNLEEICSRFVTKDSNRELVQEIGLIRSDGIPSFVLPTSPCIHESTLLSPPWQCMNVNAKDLNTNERIASFKQDSCGATVSLQNTSDGSSKKNAITNTREGCLGPGERKCAPSKDLSEAGVSSYCVIPPASLRPLLGKALHVLMQLKINLLEMEAVLPEEAMKPSRAKLERRWAWREYVKSAKTIYEMVLATITLEEMIETRYLRKEWWYWSSLSAAAKTSTVSSLALRIYSLDAAIMYEKTMSNSDDSANIVNPNSTADQQPLFGSDTVDNCKVRRKSNRKRKEPEG